MAHLFWPEAGRHPGVLLQHAARVVVGGGAALEARCQLADLVLHHHHQVALVAPSLEASRHGRARQAHRTLRSLCEWGRER